MSNVLAYQIDIPLPFPSWEFETVEVEYHRATQSLWMHYKETAPPHYSLQTVNDVGAVGEALQALFASPDRDDYPIRYFVMASRRPGVFKLGGDLAMFADAILDNEREKLRAYAHACAHVMYSLFSAFDLPIVTLSVVEGKALGGGLEAALAEDYLLVGEEATLGVPEVAFNTFPGMGAVSLLNRRLGNAAADEVMSSGKTFTGREAYEMGLADLVAPAGQSRAAALAWMAEDGAERFERRRQIAGLRRRIFPVSRDELVRITDVWVECCYDVTSRDVRHMQRLAAAQRRSFR